MYFECYYVHSDCIFEIRFKIFLIYYLIKKSLLYLFFSQSKLIEA